MSLLNKLRGIFTPKPAPMPMPSPAMLERLKARWGEIRRNGDKKPGRYGQHGMARNVGERRLARAMLRLEKWESRRSCQRRNPHGGPWQDRVATA